jgi:tetratricopeptide (TPR) repeat protein
LTAKAYPDQAVRAIQDALLILDEIDQRNEIQSEPDLQEMDFSEMREMGIALLAKSQAASGALEDSLSTFSQALETNLANDVEWRSDLAIGMGRVALELDQPEIAIAALKEVSQDEIQNTVVAQILTEAYAAISLTQEALYTARTAVHLAPDNVDTLSWFADKSVELGVASEAIPALTSAAQLDPQRTDLVIRLGNVLAKVGKTKSASEAYLSTLSSSFATPENLYQAADGLSEIGDEDGAVKCLERALELQPHPPLQLILDLANAYESGNKFELAIKTLDKGIEVEPENAQLHSLKADQLRKIGRHAAARACLEHALILHPKDPQIQLRMAELLREQGDLYAAFVHANKIVEQSEIEPNTFLDFIARGLVADLGRATLQDHYTQKFIADQNLEGVPDINELTPGSASLLASIFCLYAELALEREEQIAAASALNQAYSLEPNNPRVLALQSRMALRQGDLPAAREQFCSAVELLRSEEFERNNQHFSSNNYLGIALAGIDLQDWDLAQEMLTIGLSTSPMEPILNLQKAKIYVLRAEFQRLCQMTEIVGHSPGAKTLSPSTIRQFEEAIEETINSLSDDQQAELPKSVTRWHTRGSLVFQPNEDHIQAFEHFQLEPSDQASLLAAYTATSDLPTITKRFHTITEGVDLEKVDPKLLLIYALSLGLLSPDEIGIEKGLDAIAAAIVKKPSEAISYWVQAKLTELVDDPLMAKSAIESALSLWPDEPRWQAYAAVIANKIDDQADAINHLEKAISLEPAFISHYLALGKAHIYSGNSDDAIRAYEKAIQVAPDQYEAYQALAAVQSSQGKYKSAVRNAEKAIKMAPEKIQPVLLRAEIAINMEKHSEAMEHVENALQAHPNHPEALFLKATILEDLGEIEQALMVIEKAIPVSNKPLPLLLKRIELQSNTMGLETNLLELEQLSTQYPDNPLVLAPYAYALAASGRDNESIQIAKQVLQNTSSKLPIEQRAEIHHLLGLQLKATGHLDQSIHQLTESIRLGPKNIDTYLDLGQTQEERRQHSMALDTYKKAMSICPADPRPYFQAGLLLKASRDYPAAESMFRRAAERAPDDISIHRQLAGIVAINLIHSRQPAAQEV